MYSIDVELVWYSHISINKNETDRENVIDC